MSIFPFSIKKKIIKYVDFGFFAYDEKNKISYDFNIIINKIIKWNGTHIDIRKFFEKNEDYLIFKKLIEKNEYILQSSFINIFNALHFDMDDWDKYYSIHTFLNFNEKFRKICELFFEIYYANLGYTLYTKNNIFLEKFIKKNSKFLVKIFHPVNYVLYDYYVFKKYYTEYFSLELIINLYIFKHSLYRKNFFEKSILYTMSDHGYINDKYILLQKIIPKHHNLYYKYYRPQNYDNNIDLILNKFKIIKLFDYYDYITKYQEIEIILPESVLCMDNDDLKTIKYKQTNFLINPDQFHKRFNEYTDSLINFIEDWSNIIFAGGGVFNILNNHPNCNKELISKSDIDLFLFGDITLQIRNVYKIIKKIKQVYKDASIIFDNHINHDYNKSKFKIIEIHIPNKRIIQFILNENTYNSFDIIKEFDFSCYQIYYDGKDLYSTVFCLHAYKFWYCNIASDLLKDNDYKSKKYVYRMVKTMKKGMHLNIDKNIIDDYIEDGILDDVENTLDNYKKKRELFCISNDEKIKNILNDFGYELEKSWKYVKEILDIDNSFISLQ
jgi:hypothetical protein